jgi:hypothetical protein
MLMVRNSCLDPYASRDDDELWRDVRAGWVALIFVTVNKLVRFHLPGVGIVPVDAAKLMLEEPDLARRWSGIFTSSRGMQIPELQV